MIYRLLLLIIFLLQIECSLKSQKILDFDKLSIDDGFTSSRANTIIQDQKGLIWIGTWNGLNRYDGYNCEIFRPGYHDTTTISNREISALIEDHEGNIWIGTTSGLNKLDPKTRKIKRYHFQNRIISLFEDSNQIIWIGTWNDGLYKLDPQTGVINHYLTSDIISDIYEDSRNIFWVATYYGLINFDRSTSTYIRYLPDENRKNQTVNNSTITQIVETDNNNLFIGTWGGGLNKIIMHPNRDSIRFVYYTTSEKKESVSSNVIYRLFYDKYGNLWVGTWNNGLNLLEHNQQDKSPEEAVFYRYINNLSDPNGISGNNISALFVDRSGVLWVGSLRIDRTSIIPTGFNRHRSTKLVNGKVQQNPVRSIGKQDEYLWVGTKDELKLYKSDDNIYKFIKDINTISYKYGNIHYVSSSILSIVSNESGLWLGTDDAGLILFKGKSAIKEKNPDFIYFNTETNTTLPGNKVCNLAPSKKYPGVIWIGTLQNGFAQLTYKDGKSSVKIYRAGYDNKSVSDNNIRSVIEDKNGIVWIGTQNGLNRFDPESQTFMKFFYSQPDTNSINDNVINVIYEDTSGDLWVGTNLGLNKKQSVNLPDGTEKITFKSYPDIQYLDNELITNILEDNSGNIWIGLYQGMIKFDKLTEKVEKEYFIKEYRWAVISRNAAVKDNNGLFLLGGNKGFISFYPDSLLKQSIAPKACITDLLVSNKSINILNENKNEYKLENTIPYSQSVNLTYRDKILTFIFSAMDFKYPKKNEYSYFLEGFDKEWNNVGSRNSATYTNIKPGEYIFKLKGANSDGVWQEEPVTFKVKISSPWWKTTIAYIIYGILFIGLLYFFNQYSIIGVREKGRILIEHMHYEKEYELNELKSLFFTNITHEFRTPLTLILGPAEELLKNNELSNAAKRQAELIQRNAQRLLRLVNQLMEFRKVEKGKMEIYLQKCNIVPLLNDIYDSFKGMADSKGIDFNLFTEYTEILADVDFEKYEKVLFNLVSNAFKYTEEGGKINIRASIEFNVESIKVLVVEIEDTGIGIAKEYKEKVFERFFQAHPKHTQSTGGIGLFLSKAFIELHGGTIGIESELGQGSCFRVTLPLENKLRKETIPEKEVIEEKVEISTSSNETIINENTDQQDILNETAENKAPLVLIVEDDNELNEFIVSGLNSEFNVIGTFNGREGLETARKIFPDIIITDIMMPEMDGIELCKLLRKDLVTSHIPVIFLTAKTMHEDEINGLKIGAIDYIYKPFNLIALKLKIQNILDNRKSIHDKIRANQIMKPEQIELSSLDEKFLKDAVQAVNDYLDDPTFDVEKFSNVIGISANQAYRKIKALTGQTAKEFIRNQRLKTAASLLLQKKRSISEIIYMVGFSSPSYFTRCFREYYGCTPKEYIEKEGNLS